MYVSNYGNNSISKINMSDGSMINASWVAANAGLSSSGGLAIDNTGTYMYVANNGNNTISKINMSDGSMNNASWISASDGISNPYGLIIDSIGTYMYVTNVNMTVIYKITLQLISLCFNKDTLILTNKGYLKIQDLKKGDMVKIFNDGYKPIAIIGYQIIMNKINYIN